MAEVSVTQARERLADVVDDARVNHQPVYLTRRGKRIAAVVDATDLEALLRDSEDLADLRAAAAARAELDSGETAVLWDQVKADLGLIVD
ncbi:MAG: type II toxin-antitoxin system Phd/YefM family antitoxin [Candidatus Nanopelagicales bacterium]|jgi:prevent-host-death family protein